MSRRTVFRTIALTTAAMLCFSANSILCRLALAPGLVDAATFTTVRVASAAAMLSLVTWLWRRHMPRLTQVNPLSAAALLAYLVFFAFAYRRLDAGSGALVLIGAVQLIMFSIAFWEGERFMASQWAGLGMALVGFVYLILPGVSAPDPFGTALMALSGTAWGFLFPARSWQARSSRCERRQLSLVPDSRRDRQPVGGGWIRSCADGFDACRHVRRNRHRPRLHRVVSGA